MALHLSTLAHQTWPPATSISPSDTTRTARSPRRRIELGSSNSKGGTCCSNVTVVECNKMTRKSVAGLKCASMETVETQIESLVGKVTEVNKDTFWPIVNAAQDKLIVLDMYTQWCGPCKLMSPKFEKLAQDNLDAIFLKLDCNQENKPLAKELGIRVVPTFKILKDSQIVKEVTGAKFDKLVEAIDSCCT